MAYDDYLADRVRQTLKEKKTRFSEKKMMGGLCFLVDDKMLCGIHIDKNGESLLMGRIGEAAYAKAIKKKEVLPMDFTGQPMKGYVFVKPQGFDMDKDLTYWLQLCLDFNPLAKAGKKKSTK